MQILTGFGKRLGVINRPGPTSDVGVSPIALAVSSGMGGPGPQRLRRRCMALQRLRPASDLKDVRYVGQFAFRKAAYRGSGTSPSELGIRSPREKSSLDT